MAAVPSDPTQPDRVETGLERIGRHGCLADQIVPLHGAIVSGRAASR
ncbi:hypothetical protein O1R50_07520 [Glycomyces luteolus]|uniref:Uncharacterized protein n=1 Tax=Glycomyces luteolus TaxID=2670330 RepID=A0A9X3PBE1_9ACTN|nr:hypothetical protein [Glycomyces luteolus]MDA1359464.1 hypothetical protein [Glycomyces luteolus]